MPTPPNVVLDARRSGGLLGGDQDDGYRMATFRSGAHGAHSVVESAVSVGRVTTIDW
jgi:hypothetical protein